jgi:alkanesulfonate monooxygenase SsuD/methylene tetrahydromethanopterin reductase-like flavin-dependent oxidoreductase (luciferase family)
MACGGIVALSSGAGGKIMKVDFGIFDHLDHGGFELGEHYRNRLRLIENYDAAGFYSYHLAEHHGSSLGMAPSPSVFLSAVAQRTQRLRMGPMVYVLPLHDPLRLIEEICMIDQMSGGRMEVGVGRGQSPFELGIFSVGHLEARKRFPEALQVLLLGLTKDVLDFEGKYYTYTDVPMALQPVQKPHPPLWYGVTRPESAAWAAKNRVNTVMNGPSARVKSIVDRYVTEWRAAHGDEAMSTKLGTTRHIHVADTDAQAEETARRGYAVWFDSNAELFRRYGTLPLHFPSTYDEAAKREMMVVGAPETVRGKLDRIASETGTNYVIGRFAFGDIPVERVLRSVDLFAKEVMLGFKS